MSRTSCDEPTDLQVTLAVRYRGVSPATAARRAGVAEAAMRRARLVLGRRPETGEKPPRRVDPTDCTDFARMEKMMRTNYGARV